MSRETYKVEKWVKERQNNCPDIRWEKMEGNAFRPFCENKDNGIGRCVYKYCPLNKVKSNKEPHKV